ncbi:MAG: CxxxxCH/CxxCH domain-containing protein [Thermodesulfovibrionales bacterium]
MTANYDTKGEHMRISSVLRDKYTARFLVMLILIMAGLGLAGWPLGPQDAGAAVTAGNSSTATGTGATSLSIAMPAGTAANDIMIANIINATGVTVTPPTGWTSVGAGNGSATIRQSVFWKRAVSGETGPYSFTQGTTTTAMSGGITSFSGCLTTGTPYVLGTASTGNSATLSAAGVTPSAANSMLVYAGVIGTASTFSGVSGTNPAISTPYNVNFNGNTRAVLIASGIKTDTTTSGTRTATASATGRWRAVQLSLAPALTPPTTITIGNGTDPASNSATTPLGPGGVATNLDAFTLAVNQQTTTVNSVTVTLAAGSAAGIGDIRIMNSGGGTTYFSAVTNPSSDTITFSGGTGLPVTTTATTFIVRITPRSHAGMPVPPGSMYVISGTVTAVTTADDATITTKTYSDSGSATLYIDNLSTANPSSLAATQAVQHTVLSWSNPVAQDFSNVLLVRQSGSAVAAVPAEGQSYAVNSTLTDGSIVRYNGSGTSYDDLQLADGTHYYYKIFARDSRGNYSANGIAADITPGAVCIRANPIVIIQPPAQDIVVDGGTIKYIVSITNKDIGCSGGSEVFNVAVTKDTNGTEFLPSTLSVPSVALQSEGSINIKLFATAKAGLTVMGDTAIKNTTAVTVTRNIARSGQGPITSNDAVSTITRRVPKMHNSANMLHKDPNDPMQTLPSDKWGPNGWGIAGGQYGEFVCATCHKPRATNIKSVKSTITLGGVDKSVLLENVISDRINAPNGLGDDDPNGDGSGHSTSTKVCEVCHTKTKYHNANTTNNKTELGLPVLAHNNDQDCIVCHGHDVAFNALASPCDTCHGYPPPALAVSDKHPDGTGSQTVGMHDFHNATNAAGRMIVCDTCHANAVGTGFNDNGKITLGFLIYPGKGPDGAGFKGGRYDGQTTAQYDASEPNTIVTNNQADNKKCSSVYCHGGTMQPNGGRPWSYWDEPNAAVCLTCHGASSDDPPTKGEHVKHAGTSGNNMPCTDCHLGFKPDTIPSNLPTHVNGEANFKFDTGKTYIGAAATYIPDPAGPDAGKDPNLVGLSMPNTFPYTKTYGSCSSVAYCHPGGSPQWGSGALPNSCHTCHSDQGAGANAGLYTGVHSTKHTQSYLIACESCHSRLQSDGSKVTKHSTSGLVSLNQAAEVQFTDKTGTIQYGDAGSTFYYKDLETSPYGVGAVVPAYTAGGSSAGADPKNTNFSWTAGTCSNIWCHSNANPINGSSGNLYTSPTWAGTAACNTCHSAATDATRTWSPAHDKHTTSVSGYNFTCDVCHNTVATNNTTVSNPLLHANGVKNVNFNTTYGGQNTPYASPSCSNTYCHSDGTSVASGAAPVHVAESWADTMACNSCHGIPSDPSGRPSYNDISDVPPGPKANEHVGATVNKHASMDCNTCHFTVTTTGNTITNPALHVNKQYNVSSGPGTNYQFTYAYDPAGGTCATTYCHSTVQADGGVGAGASETPKWGQNGWGDCATRCHKSGTNLTTGTHQKHITDFDVVCESCHDGGTGDPRHANFVVDMTAGVGYSQGDAAPQTGGYGTCTTYCHSSAQGPDGIAAPTYAATTAWGGGPVTTAVNGSCVNSCHNTDQTDVTHPNKLASGGHGLHVGEKSIACDTCHNGAGPGSNPNLHVDGLIQVSFSNGVTGTYTDTGGGTPQGTPQNGLGTCSTTCHVDAANGNTPYPAGQWGGSSGSVGLTCGSCHLYDPAAIGSAPSLDVEGKGAHAKHISHLLSLTGQTLDATSDSWGDTKFQLICGACHDVSQNVLHHDGARTIRMPSTYQFGSSPPIYNGVSGISSGVTPKTCSNVSCHYTTTPVWSAY